MKADKTGAANDEDPHPTRLLHREIRLGAFQYHAVDDSVPRDGSGGNVM
jgi:hypothetical protein